MSSLSKRPKMGQRIRPVTRKQNPDQFTEAWDKLSTAIKEVYKKNASSLSFEELYRNAYNMVVFKLGDRLYESVYDLVKEHLNNMAKEKIVSKFPQTDSANEIHEFLIATNEVWDHHTTCMKMTRDILMYLDRIYVQSANKPHIIDMGMDLFRDVVVRSIGYPIKSHLIQALLFQITTERDGNIANRDVIKSVLLMMQTLRSSTEDDLQRFTVYDMDFEEKFLDTSTIYFDKKSKELLNSGLSSSEYLKKVEQIFQEEEIRWNLYLNSATIPKIRTVLENTFLKQHVDTIVNMERFGLHRMIADKMFNDILRMYRLLGHIVPTGYIEMRQSLKSFIIGKGKELFELCGILFIEENPESPSALLMKNSHRLSSASNLKSTGVDALKWVDGLIELKKQMDRVLNASMCNDRDFLNEINASLEIIFNAASSGPEYLSLYIDENLRKGLKGKTEDEIESTLDSTISLFKYMKEKDIFEGYYKQHLAKRLLFGKSISEDAEKNLIVKLKVECGNQFTSKLEGMFNDMRLSYEICKDYNRIHAEDKSCCDLEVSILTTTCWPVSLYSGGCTYPVQILTALEKFQSFYLSRFSGRKLTWLPNMGTADLKVTLNKGKKEFNLSTFSMIVLLSCFNDIENAVPIAYEKIVEQTNINEEDLKRTLQSLSVAKYKILIKSTPSKEIKETDEFNFNLDFQAPQHKIKIPTILASSGNKITRSVNNVETEAERQVTLEKIEEDRKHQIEAAIVRIMKSRKCMEHGLLVTEVIQQLSSRFKPDPVMIKRRIEGLIEREYLERDQVDRKLYHYLA